MSIPEIGDLDTDETRELFHRCLSAMRVGEVIDEIMLAFGDEELDELLARLQGGEDMTEDSDEEEDA